MQARLHGALANAQTSRDLFDAQVPEEAQRDDHALVWRQLGHGRPQEPAIVHWAVGVNGLEPRLSGEVLGGPSRDAPQPISAGVDQDPIEPMLEQGRVPQGRPLAPGHDKGVVGRVLSLGALAEDDLGEAVAGVKMLIGESSKGISTRGQARNLDELAIRHCLDLTRSHCTHDTWQAGNVPWAERSGAFGGPTIESNTSQFLGLDAV
jgi:hypothetical protein